MRACYFFFFTFFTVIYVRLQRDCSRSRAESTVAQTIGLPAPRCYRFLHCFDRQPVNFRTSMLADRGFGNSWEVSGYRETDGGCNDRLLLLNVSLFTRIAECKLSITDVGPDRARFCWVRIYQHCGEHRRPENRNDIDFLRSILVWIYVCPSRYSQCRRWYRLRWIERKSFLPVTARWTCFYRS